MLEEFLKILHKIDIGTIVVVAMMLWQMYTRIDKKFDAIDKKFDAIDKKFDAIDRRFDAVDRRFEKMQETMTDIDRRLCRLEGAFQAKECCLLKSDTQHKISNDT